LRITSIRVAGLRGATPRGGWTAELNPDDVVHTLVAVETDEGITGYGSVSSNEDLTRAAVDLLAPHWKDENALEPERVSEKLHQVTFWLGRGGSVTHAISGIDIALWDILVKATGQPVGRLLGGRYRTRVRPYASLLADHPGPMTDELAVQRARGFQAFKIGWGSFGRDCRATDEAIVAAAREAVGPRALLLIDAGGSEAFWPHGYKWALRTADMLAAYDVHWFEEPLRPDAISDYADLRTNAHVQIAGGEVLTRRQSFEPWLQRPAVDVIQPDITKVGGLSEARRIGWLADTYGVRVIPHGWNTAIGLAADLHLSAALPSTDLVEYMTGSDYIDRLSTRRWVLDAEGMLEVPDQPGLGIDLDPEALERYTGGALSSRAVSKTGRCRPDPA
jgi:L-alanine-DL-glutamate epimerase-like enolase superfamily enzyme